jgi:BMFP domain-containing protein YqiC
MAKASNDLFSTLRTYITKLTEGERSPAEVAAALNGWARESAEALKAKIHEEVDASVTRMGFVKREEFDRLAAEVASLKATKPKSAVKKSDVKKPAAKKSTVKKAVVKKSSAKKVVKK